MFENKKPTQDKSLSSVSLRKPHCQLLETKLSTQTVNQLFYLLWQNFLTTDFLGNKNVVKVLRAKISVPNKLLVEIPVIT